MAAARDTSNGPPRAAVGAAVAAALAAAALLAAAARDARATDLTTTGTCFASGQRIVLSGAGFTPGGPVAISGVPGRAVQADALGAFTTEVEAPAVGTLRPATVVLTAVDGANPATTARLRIPVVREAFGSNVPVAGRPHEQTVWRFAGFVPERPIYGHFVLAGRWRADYRFGVARGACGTLSVRAPRIPVAGARRPGRWRLKLDQRRRYRATTPGRAVRFDIVRRSGGGAR